MLLSRAADYGVSIPIYPMGSKTARRRRDRAHSHSHSFFLLLYPNRRPPAQPHLPAQFRPPKASIHARRLSKHQHPSPRIRCALLVTQRERHVRFPNRRITTHGRDPKSHAQPPPPPLPHGLKNPASNERKQQERVGDGRGSAWFRLGDFRATSQRLMRELT